MTQLHELRGRGDVTSSIADAMWTGLGGAPEATARLVNTGAGEMSCPFPVMDVAAAAIGTAGLAVSELLRGEGNSAPAVSVDRRQATTWFDFPVAPSRFLDTAESHGVHQRWMAEFATADSRWIRVQATYPDLRRRMLSALGLSSAAGPDDVAGIIAGMDGEDAEELLVAGGAAAALARSIDEWRDHPQGRAVAREPLVDTRITSRVTVGDGGWRPTPGRPLLGVRVLDLTRVVAAPMATRFLASLGAEVLRVDGPSSDEVALLGVHDVSLGKRWALLDVRDPDGRERLGELISGADIIVHGYRPGALDDLGFDVDTRARLRPGLVDVTLDAYGWTGPWRSRRGFDTLVQYSSGIADEVARWAAADPATRLPINALGHRVDASRPRHLPVEALDFGTGYMMAAAAILGLRRRTLSGEGSATRMSLARTAQLVIDHRSEPDRPDFDLPDDGAEFEPSVVGMGARPTRRLAQPVVVDGSPLFWDRPAELPGSSAPVWASPARPL